MNTIYLIYLVSFTLNVVISSGQFDIGDWQYWYFSLMPILFYITGREYERRDKH